MEEKFSFILFLVTVADLYFNYYTNEFPEYHRLRIKSDILTLLAVLLPIILVLFICCMGCFLYFQWLNNNIVQKCTGIITIIFILLIIICAISSTCIQIYSIYIYFKDDGSTKITKLIIKILMWVSFVNILIKLFFAICDFISSLKQKQKEKEEEMVELEQEE